MTWFNSNDLRVAFDATLARIIAGVLPGCPTETGLDTKTMAALDAVAAAVAGNGDVEAAAQAADSEFAAMLDGTHFRDYWLNAEL